MQGGENMPVTMKILFEIVSQMLIMNDEKQHLASSPLMGCSSAQGSSITHY